MPSAGLSRPPARAGERRGGGPAGTLARALAIALLAFVCIAAPATASKLEKESVSTFEGQLNGHQVHVVSLHSSASTFHIALVDGRKLVVSYSDSEKQRLLEEIKAKGITVKVAKTSAPSHKLRYIVGAIVIVVIVLVVVALLYTRRRRLREEEGGGAPAAGAR